MDHYKQVFQCLLDSLDHIVILLDTDFGIKDINAKSKELFAWKQGFALGKHVLEVFEQSGIEKPVDYALDAIEPGKIIPLKRTSVFYKNQKHTLAWHIRYWPQVNLYILEGYIVQASLSHSLGVTEEFLPVLNYLPCIIFWKDNNLVYRGGNIRFLKHSGCNSFEEIVGKTDFDFPWRDEAESFINDDREVLKTGREKLYAEHTVKTCDGSVLNVISNKVPLKDEMNKIIGVLGIAIDVTAQKQREDRLQESIRLEKRKFFDQSQTLERISQEVFGVNPDTNQSIDLKKLVIFLKAIISNMPGNVFWKDLNSVYMGCNDHVVEVCGLSNRSDIVGLTDVELEKKLGWQSGTAERFRQDDINVITSREAQTYEDVFIQADGKKVVMFTKKTPIFDDAGKVSGILAVSLEITKLKQKEAELRDAKKKAEAASESKSEFIANMSHDIRTPITGMIGMAEDMIHTAKQTQASLEKQEKNTQSTQAESNAILKNMIETIKEDADLLIGATDQLLQLCNEILEVASLEIGKPSTQVESFNFHEIMQHNIELLLPVAQHKKLHLSCDIAADVPTFLKGLGIYLDRILLNLIGNALKFTAKGFVKVTAQLVNSNMTMHQVGDAITLQIAVQDSGMGIPKDKFDTIFEHFSRLTPSYQGLYKGAGLGLYTVKRYVVAMQGRITLDSELGKGTCFTLTLPLTVSDHADRKKEPYRHPQPTTAAVKIKAANKEPTTAATEKITGSVLLVEDSALAVIAVKAALKSLGCAIDVAETGAAAVSLVERNPYDLILMDIGLPDFSGVDATKKIRALSDPKKANVPIVAVTGHAGNPDKRQEALDAGMQEVISKPAQKLALELILDSYVFKKSEAQTASLIITPSDAAPELELALLDWDACVRMCQGDADMARELLSVLAADLKKTAPLLANDYANNDTRALRDNLHRLRGGVCYLKLPQLDHALSTFHEAVKAKPQDPPHVKATYEAVQQAIEAFYKVWDGMAKKT